MITPHTMPKLVVSRISKAYRRHDGSTLQALSDVSLTLEAGCLLSLIGHSGCGKSTLLNIVAGLDTADAGEIRVDNQRREGPGPDRGMVFQSYTLFPWLSVRDNVAFGLRMSGTPKKMRDDIARHYLSLVQLEQFANYFPRQLSGGMRQRAALARALANKPSVLLMDEPFGALDAETREHMHELLMTIRARESMTVLFITHDIEEAVFLSDRIGIMSANPGRLADDFYVTLPKERDADTRLSQSFLANKRDVIARFRACYENLDARLDLQ